jgi:hypothetical protein
VSIYVIDTEFAGARASSPKRYAATGARYYF